MSKYVLYHADCNDGMGAAYAAWLKFGDYAKYLPVQYNRPLPEIAGGSDVFILDFSYKRDILESLRQVSNSLLVLDHHKTARDDLIGLDYATFDMNKSGAMLAWEYFHPDKEVPNLIKLIQDRDLWIFGLPGSREVAAALPLIGGFRELHAHADDQAELLLKGGVKLSFDSKDINASSRKAVASKLFGHRIALINTTTLISDIGNHLYTNFDVDFAMMYFILNTGEVVFSLRSESEERCDVSLIAKQIGDGGGHPSAAGVKLNTADGLRLLAQLYERSTPLADFIRK